MKYAAIQKIIWVIVISCFMTSYVVSYEEDGVTITISNLTRYYLHVMIDNSSHLYVAPGGVVQTETQLSSAFVEVFYSPGQGVSGRAQKELTSTTTTITHYSDSNSNTCSGSSNKSCSSSSYGTGVTSSDYSRSPMSWTVTAADFVADSLSVAN
jgi:hypothetical protein